MEKKPKFTIRKGEMNGVYLVTEREKHGAFHLVTLKCTVCGHEVTRTSTTFRPIADKNERVLLCEVDCYMDVDIYALGCHVDYRQLSFPVELLSATDDQIHLYAQKKYKK